MLNLWFDHIPQIILDYEIYITWLQITLLNLKIGCYFSVEKGMEDKLKRMWGGKKSLRGEVGGCRERWE